MNDEEIDNIAGEYVLGTLSYEERRDFELKLQGDPSLQAVVRAWEEKLAPLSDDELQDMLSDQTRFEATSAKLWQKIDERLEKQIAGDDLLFNDNNNLFGLIAVAQMRQSRNRWRSAAIGAFALAAGFIGLQALGVTLPFMPNPAVEQRYVAILNPDGSSPGFLIRVDTGQKRLDIQRIADHAPSGKDYELWLIEPEKPPLSLNVVGREKAEQVNYLASSGQKALTFAITLEPQGGSPSGVATGPIVYSGSLLDVD